MEFLRHLPYPPMLRKILAITLVFLLTTLTACGVAVGPPHDLVERAIALQFSQTEEELIQVLYPGTSQFPPFSIDHMRITDQKPLKIDELRSYRIRGTYDLTLAFPDRAITQRDNPFEVYLQRQVEGKTWRLARRQLAPRTTDQQAAKETWTTQLVL